VLPPLTLCLLSLISYFLPCEAKFKEAEYRQGRVVRDSGLGVRLQFQSIYARDCVA
jgi:hypothetical protein